MNRTLTSFGQGWWERIPSKLDPNDLDKDPEARSKALRSFEERSRRPASPEDSEAAEIFLRKHLVGEYTSASVILPSGHGHACPKGGGWVRF